MVHSGCSSEAMGKSSVRAQLEFATPLGAAFQQELEGAPCVQSVQAQRSCRRATIDCLLNSSAAAARCGT